MDGTREAPVGLTHDYPAHEIQGHFYEPGALPSGTTAKPPVYAQFVVPQRHVKLVKNALEEYKLLNKKANIVRHEQASQDFQEPHMSLVTNLPLELETYEHEGSLLDRVQDKESSRALREVLTKLRSEGVRQREIKATPYIVNDNEKEAEVGNPILKGLKKGLYVLPQEILASVGLTADALMDTFPARYTIYRPMLLLPHNAFTSAPWKTLLEANPPNSPTLQPLWKALAASLSITHIALNAGIPLQTTSPTTSQTSPHENILRSPTNLTPLHGSFGPPPTPQTLSSPSAADFANALWVTHTQNGIHQTWAPLYTMFSRGNVREKTRLLALPSITTAPCSAADLYAGIGYFAFSYARAGVAKVLCWELNPWSIEGLRRGAGMNGWSARVVDDPGSVSPKNMTDGSDFLVFPQSNESALATLQHLKKALNIPPIRHVNCGFLPSSRLSWRTAVGLLDRGLGGWIHAHENVGVEDVEARRGDVVRQMERHLEGAGLRGEVRCEHVERVKTYAPGVLHVVFDVWVGPMRGVDGSGE